MSLIFRLLVTLMMFVLIAWNIDLTGVREALYSAHINLLIIALLLQCGSSSLAAVRWRMMMLNLGFSRPLRFYWCSYFKGMFFNQGLPSSIGGDVLRVLDIYRQGVSKQNAFYSVLIDRIIGLTALLLLNIIAYALNLGLLPKQANYVITLMLLSGLFGIAGLFLLRYLPGLERHPWLLQIKVFSQQLGQAASAQRPLLLLSSLLIHLLTMLGLYAIGLALGLPFDLAIYLVIVPPALLLTMLPISLAGWGVREGAMVVMFTLIGADQITVLAMSLLYGILLLIVSLPGLLIYLRSHYIKRLLRAQS